MSGIATVWTGTAFINCYSTVNEIILPHYRFLSTYGVTSECNNGAIVARSLSTEGNNFTSQLNVTLNFNTAGKTIMCFSHDIHVHTSTIHLSTVLPTTGLSPRIRSASILASCLIHQYRIAGNFHGCKLSRKHHLMFQKKLSPFLLSRVLHREAGHTPTLKLSWLLFSR